ncbi:MAG: thiamine-phosphate kinase [Streptosporangiaceae bacterium]|nr:thiamine-phosphate kinase [Streptosporangiaceae bacterium]
MFQSNVVEEAIIAAEERTPSPGTPSPKTRSPGTQSPGTQSPRTLESLGEFGLIEALSAWLPPAPGTLVGIGDDAAVLAAPDGRVVATTDFLIEGRHFRLDWSAAADVGHKAAARSLADVAAMGAEPSGLLVALAAPPDLPVSWLESFASGLARECARAGTAVLGGDTSRAGSVVLAVTGLGDLGGRAPVLRGGAAPGAVVAVAGPLGHAAAGLALLSAGLTPDDPDLAALVAAQLRPAPPYDAGPEAAVLGATAMIDVSDGLLADLAHIADASKVQIDVHTAALTDPLLTKAFQRTGGGATSEPLPPHRPATRTGRAGTGQTGPAAVPPELSWALTGGEDHSLVAVFPPGVPLPERWRPIGEVRPGQGVLVNGSRYQGPAGWDHFSSGG